MATSGSFNTTSEDGRYLTFSWSLQSQSVADNTSTISWRLQGAGVSGYVVCGGFTVVIDGETVYSTSTDDRIEVRTTTVVASGTKTIKHTSTGSKKFSASVSAAIYYYAVNCSGSGSWDLTDIPRQATLLTAPDFNDEGNPTITYSNPAGNAVMALDACISLTGSADDVSYRAISKTGSSYTFSLTTAERNTLRNATTTSNSRVVYFYVRTNIGGTYYYSKIAKTLSIINAAPVLTTTWQDSNTTTVALTGNNQKLIKYYSSFNYTHTYTMKKGATFVSHSITNGSTTKTIASGTFSNVENNTFTTSIKDSRGNTSSGTITPTMVNYIKLTASTKADITIGGVMTFTTEGNWFNGSFGAVTNALTVRYRYREANGTYSDWANATYTSNGNTYSVVGTITGLNYRVGYEVDVEITDKLDSRSAGTTAKAYPVYDWGENDFKFNVPLVRIQDNAINDFIVERSTEAMGSNGTWYIEKWASGKAVCYGTRNYGNTGVSTAWGNWYVSSTFTQDFPSGLFTDVPDFINISLASSSGQAAMITTFNAPTKDRTQSFQLTRATSLTVQQAKIAFHIVGRWK